MATFRKRNNLWQAQVRSRKYGATSKSFHRNVLNLFNAIFLRIYLRQPLRIDAFTTSAWEGEQVTILEEKNSIRLRAIGTRNAVAFI
ncbi:MAG: hypothetical protein CMD99_08435 [Gammaproteobacteria bacterium]|nr:hypothetical protein [Gammaproteobacteria bacterium]